MPEWPVQQIPEIYPPGTGEELHNEVEVVRKAMAAIVRKWKAFGRERILQEAEKWTKAHYYGTLSERANGRPCVFISSSVAPELDCWVDVGVD